MVETRLRWCAHVERRPTDSVVRRVNSQITRDRGRPIKTIRKTIKKDIELNELNRNMVYDNTLWPNLVY